MNNIEKGLQEIDTHNIKTIQSLNNIVSNTIYRTADSSNKTSKKLDIQFKKNFPELEKLGTISTEPFNPKIVCEFRNGKAYNVLDDMQLGDKSKGLLPNRNVLGKYYLDEGSNVSLGMQGIMQGIIYCDTCKIYVDFHHCNVDTACNCSASSHKFSCGHGNIQGNRKLYCYVHDKEFILQIKNAKSTSKISVPCGCSTLHQMAQTNKNKHKSFTNHEIIRGNERESFVCIKSYEFEIDNYLNLYHKETDLYLMFNKTSFPLIGFHFKVKPFIPKRLNTLDFKFDKAFYNSVDQRPQFLSSINELIPVDYMNIIKNYFDRFRQFDGYHLESSDIDDAKVDSRDKLINSLQARLLQMTMRTEKKEKFVEHMVTEYHEQSTQNKLLNHENSELKTKIGLINLEYQRNLHEVKLEKQNTSFEELEKLKTQNFNLHRELADASSYQAKLDAVGVSYDSLKSDMDKNSIEINKLKTMNQALIDQIKNEKKVSTTLRTDNSEIHKLYIDVESRLNSIESENENLKSNLLYKTNECTRIEHSLNNIGDKSDSALENALTNRLSDIEKQRDELKEQNTNLLGRLSVADMKLSKFNSTLNSLLG